MSAARALVVSCSAGHGHVMAAHAVSEALRRRHPTLDVTEVDALRLMARWFGKSYRWTYLTLTDKTPLAWRALYAATDRPGPPGSHLVPRLAGRRFVRAIQRWKPHVLVATHFLAAEVLEPLVRQKRLETKLHLVITDHDVHRMWYSPAVHRFYVASDVVKARLSLRYGVSPERILVTGIPVRRPFTKRQDLTEIRARFGLDPRRPVVLFMSGGFTPGPIRHAIHGIWRERRDVQILAVCGKNERLRRQIGRLPRPEGATIHALGFVPSPWEPIAAADLVLTKAGGITTAECLALGKPMLLLAAIPGQEERNADALLEAGAALRAPTVEEIRWRVSRLLAEPERLASMARAARAFARPFAADAIADGAAEEVAEPDVLGPRFHGAR